jgi:hypothetical protein
MARKQAAISFPLRTYTDHELLADLALKGVHLTSPRRSTLLLMFSFLLYSSGCYMLNCGAIYCFHLLASSGSVDHMLLRFL